MRQIVKGAKELLEYSGKKTILFLDEIHRFNKAQQDFFLPYVEDGTLTLIGATTENPSFEINRALLSRVKVVTLARLSAEELNQILTRALADTERGFGSRRIVLDDHARDFLLKKSDGDARILLNTLENAIQLQQGLGKTEYPLSLEDIACALQHRVTQFDKKGDQHYNVVSAFIKSLRDSDADAALYYLARLLDGGEDPLFIVRRLIIFASEDIGNADPHALSLACTTQQSIHFVGMPEGWIPMAQCVTYLACAPKSNASYQAYLRAKADVRDYASLPIPMNILNAPTKLMKDLGYAKGYQYAHDQADHIVIQQHLPDAIKDHRYYEPTDIGYEKKLRDWWLKRRDKL